MRKSQVLLLTTLAAGACQPVLDSEPASEEARTPNVEAGDVTDDNGQVAAIEQHSWQLQALMSESGEMTPPLGETTVEIRFEDGKIGGNAGGKRYFGGYTLAGESGLVVPPEMGSTQMACPPPIADQEQRYLALLSEVSSWKIEESTLILSDTGGETKLEFVAAQPATAEGVDWQATGINNGQGGVVSTATTQLATATFSDGQLSGSGGCNRFTATYEIDSERISIGPVASTRKACPEPEGVMDQEQQYFQALENATTYRLSSDRLELRDDNGSLQVAFSTGS